MSETGNEGGQQGGDEGFKPITTQEDFNKAIAERVSRERAKFADYNDLKAKAAKVDEALEAGKTAEQRFNDRLAALEQELNSTRSQALRARIQAKFSISDEDAQLFLTGADEESLTAQAKRLAEREADRKKRGNVAPKEGGTADNASTGQSDMREFTRSLFGRADD
jgi:hypothetical protein